MPHTLDCVSPIHRCHCHISSSDKPTCNPILTVNLACLTRPSVLDRYWTVSAVKTLNQTDLVFSGPRVLYWFLITTWCITEWLCNKMAMWWLDFAKKMLEWRADFLHNSAITNCDDHLKMIIKGFYRKWVKSSFEQFITTQTCVGSTNGWIISQNAEILKFCFSTISGHLRNLWHHVTATFRWMCP